MTESMIEKGIQSILDNCPEATSDGARYAIVSFLLALREPDEGMVEAGAQTLVGPWPFPPTHGDKLNAQEAFTAMIDHILNESGKPADPI